MNRLASALLLTLAAMHPATAASPPQRVFVSGHSLVDEPLPSYLAAIAESLGTPIEWNRHYVVGSSIRLRVRGAQAAPSDQRWEGFRQGYSKRGEGLDLAAEIQQPRAVSGPYDTLMITEQHGLLGTLLWNDTVRYLRHYHDRFAAATPQLRTWFYESWFGIDDLDNPARWIAYERAASPLWQCVAERVNVSLAAQGRSDRITPLPAGVALTKLVERATSRDGVPGVSATSSRATIERFFTDGVHLTPLGVYYVALVSYASLFDRSPVGAWTPDGVEAGAALALQNLALEFVQSERETRRRMSLDECQALLQDSFIALYWGYVRDVYWKPEVGALQAWWRWAKHRAQWHWRLRRNGPENPFRYDPVTDRDWWLPAPR